MHGNMQAAHGNMHASSTAIAHVQWMKCVSELLSSNFGKTIKLKNQLYFRVQILQWHGAKRHLHNHNHMHAQQIEGTLNGVRCARVCGDV